LTGGDEGLSFLGKGVPEIFLGVRNVHRVYWLALGTCVVVVLVALVVVHSRAGHVWKAIRDDELRLKLLGVGTLGYKLVAYVVAAMLAVLVGSVYVLVVGGARPSNASVEFGLLLLVMVIIGGSGRLWGAVAGGVIYGIVDYRLTVLSDGETLGGLPHWLAGPLQEPNFLLGLGFIVLMLAAPGGLGSIVDRVMSRARSSRRRAGRPRDDALAATMAHSAPAVVGDHAEELPTAAPTP
jgi:branched-chain amino acid transport system permease protein